MFLVITPSFYPSTYYGGPSLSLYNFCIATAQAMPTNEIVVVTSNANGPNQLDFENGKEVAYLPNFKTLYYQVKNARSDSWAFFTAIKHHIRQENKTVYIASIFSLCSLVALYYARKYQRTIIVAPMGQVDEAMLKLKSYRFKKWWLRVFIKRLSPQIIWHAKSQFEAEAIQQLLPAKKMIVAPNGFWAAEYESTKTEKADVLNRYQLVHLHHPFVISSFSRLHYKKGYDLLVEAFSRLVKKYPDQHFALIIGGPDNGEKQHIVSLVQQLRIETYVRFIDYLEGSNKVDVLEASDCFALASRGENFGQVYLEALAYGTPIISTTHTPWTNVEALGIGYCAAPTTDSVYEKLQKMYQHRNNISRERCIRYARENFEWSAVANLFMQQLKSFVNESSA